MQVRQVWKCSTEQRMNQHCEVQENVTARLLGFQIQSSKAFVTGGPRLTHQRSFSKCFNLLMDPNKYMIVACKRI